jgi:D-glycerate 3-kinase
LSSPLERCGEIEGFEALTMALGYGSLADWIARWAAEDGLSLAREAWPVAVDPAWIASVGLPLLDQLQRLDRLGERALLGLAAMPGCGKTTLCAWLKRAAASQDLTVEVVSLDDFYFEGQALDAAMRDNPWRAPRGIPGSHDVELLQRCLRQWRSDGAFESPVFDKSLRQGRGDRAGWRALKADLLILEGWFVGAGPWPASEPELMSLAPGESAYRPVIQRNLAPYQALWRELDCFWQLRPTALSHVMAWKRQQNQTQQQQTGAGLSDSELEAMTRSLQVCMPEAALVAGRSPDVVLQVTAQRGLQAVELAGG